MRTTFWTNPMWGSLMWPLCTAWGIYQNSLFLAVFSAFWAGVSIDRWLRPTSNDLPSS